MPCHHSMHPPDSSLPPNLSAAEAEAAKRAEGSSSGGGGPNADSFEALTKKGLQQLLPVLMVMLAAATLMGAGRQDAQVRAERRGLAGPWGRARCAAGGPYGWRAGASALAKLCGSQSAACSNCLAWGLPLVLSCECGSAAVVM